MHDGASGTNGHSVVGWEGYGSGMAFLVAAALLAGAAAASTDSIFQFTDLVKIDGTPISLAQFKGNVRKMRALLR